MMEVILTLDFVCCSCSEAIAVTVHCTGNGLKARDGSVAAVKVPCPHTGCGLINQLYFEPNGQVRSVRPCITNHLIPEPSLN